MFKDKHCIAECVKPGSMVTPISHPVTPGIGCSPTVTLNWISERKWVYRAIKKNMNFKRFICNHQFYFVNHLTDLQITV